MPDEFVVPAGWTATTLGAIGKYTNGRAFKTSEWGRKGRPIIRIQDLTGSNRNPNYFDGEVEERYVVREDDFLISWSATLGAYIWDGPEALLNQHIFKVESKIDRRFHYHLVRERIAELERQAHGSGMVHVTKGLFESMPVAVPTDEAVQRAIAYSIDVAETAAASAAWHLASAIRVLERFRRAVLAAACSGRLTSQWRDENPDLAVHDLIPDRRGDIAPLVDTPAEWLWCQLSDIAVVKGGVQKGARLKPGEPTREVPYLRVANVQRGWLDLSEIKTIVVPERKVDELRLETGDVLFNEGGDRDKLGRGWVWDGQIDECIHQNHVFRARLKHSGLQPRYFSWYGNTIGAKYFVEGGKQTVNLASLNMSTLKALPVPVPSREEQAEIVRRVDALFALADGLRRRVEVALDTTQRSSQAVLAKAFRGELVGVE